MWFASSVMAMQPIGRLAQITNNSDLPARVVGYDFIEIAPRATLEIPTYYNQLSIYTKADHYSLETFKTVNLFKWKKTAPYHDPDDMIQSIEYPVAGKIRTIIHADGSVSLQPE